VNQPDSAYVIYYVIVVAAVAGSLFGMRQPIGKTLKMLLAWVVIFGLGFVIFSFRGEFTSLGRRLKAEATGSSISDGATVRIPIADDGHYWVEAKVNNHALRFMIDSGASVTTLSRRDAQAADVPVTGRQTTVSTANGPTLAVQSMADSLEVGSIQRSDFPVDINDRDDTNLLGMNFLSSLRSWRVEGNYLVLVP
jgi:aspartyl protease family protein